VCPRNKFDLQAVLIRAPLLYSTTNLNDRLGKALAIMHNQNASPILKSVMETVQRP
jgi:hypothetical protein